MQGNEEIDALTVIGIPVADYILLPSILALVFTMPFLYLYGCLVGMFGGFMVSIAMLNITGAGCPAPDAGQCCPQSICLRLYQKHCVRHFDRGDQLPHRAQGRTAVPPMSASRRPGPLSPRIVGVIALDASVRGACGCGRVVGMGWRRE